jgi:hypothetical protein
MKSLFGQASRRTSVTSCNASRPLVPCHATLDVYADLFDDDLDGVAVRLDAAIKTTADALRTNSTQ